MFDPSTLPKVELHLHLDTCLSYFYLRTLYPDTRLKDFNERFVAPEKCRDLADFLTKISPQIDILQTTSAIELAVDDLFDQLQADLVIYAEIRLAPLLHTRLGLTPQQVVDSVLKAMNSASQSYGIEARLILCTLRHFTEQQSLETANLVVENLNRGAVALDLAADEANFGLSNHIAAFELVKRAGGNAIAHAGEARGADSVTETLDKLKVSRIGHGVRSIEDTALIDRLKAENVLLEVCPSCNICCNVFDDITDHPIDKLKRLGVKLSINTDTRTVINTNLNKEYQLLNRVFGWSQRDFLQCNLDAISASFASPEVKQALRNRLYNIDQSRENE